MSPRRARSPAPRVLEHMVDTVLYFEGERGHQFRILRSVKNRFGPANEIGVFEMTDRRLDGGRRILRRSSSPSAAATSPASRSLPASRGHAPVLVEVQALVSPSPLATPRRAVVGWDSAPPRHDPGGAGDALRPRLRRQRGLSQHRRGLAHLRAGGRSVPWPWRSSPRSPTGRCLRDLVAFGEVGLSGEVRMVTQAGVAPQGSGQARLQAGHPGPSASTRPRARS